MSDTEVQQLVIYVGTQAKIDAARQAGTIGPDDFAVVTDAPEFALQSSVQAIQVLIPSQATAQNQLADKNYVDNSTLPSSTKYGASLTLSIDSSDYKVTATLKDQDGNILGTQQVIDLPLESVVVSGSYDSVNKKIVLTLQNGNTIDVPVGDLVAGLQTEITSQNKLASDLVDDTNQTNKFVTSGEKTTWNNKQNAINDLDEIRAGASAGSTAVQPATLNDYVTKNTTQTITAQKTFLRTETAFQDSVARFVSTYNSSNQGWRGRVIIGAKDYTFLIGTYNGMAAIGGHKFSDSATESNADWSDIYFQPDGNKAVYLGGYSWRPNSGWFKVQNNASDSGGKIQVNIGTIANANWKDVAYKGENISDFNNNSGYITGITSSDVTTALGYTPIASAGIFYWGE